MTIDEMRVKIAKLQAQVQLQMPKARDPGDKVIGEIAITALQLAEELLVDFKRMADALERMAK